LGRPAQLPRRAVHVGGAFAIHHGLHVEQDELGAVAAFVAQHHHIARFGIAREKAGVGNRLERRHVVLKGNFTGGADLA